MSNKFKIFHQKYKKQINIAIITIFALCSLLVLSILLINAAVIAQTADDIYSVDSVNEIEGEYDCILILGAGVKPDGSPTHMLEDRLIVAEKAYKASKSSILFASGDSEQDDYTETVTMKKVLLEAGIDESAILCDGYGLSTYESIWRAKNVYGFDKILIVSQKYHLYRALFLAKSMGIEAKGIDGALRSYGKQPIFSAREAIARIKDVLYSIVTPEPTYIEKWN